MVVSRMPTTAYSWRELTVEDVSTLCAIEARAHAHPWSMGNFQDCFLQGYAALGLCDDHGRVLGFAIMMPVLDELHLLDIVVDPDEQRQGMGRMLLEEVFRRARVQGFVSMLLEVRDSNAVARSLYGRCEFVPIGLRKNYYPLHAQAREHAIVMRKML